jgi:hypothetical protein
MTAEQLQAIRARLDAAANERVIVRHLLVGEALAEYGHLLAEDLSAPSVLNDVRALLDEVERLKAREESLVQQSVAQIGLSGRLQEEVERLRDALEDIASGDYSDPLCMKTPEARARAALEIK